ncbi:MAG: phosphoenolpyruvate--protein phosphotransferase, partial [Desulfobacteraceae bacterium]|nr:phosphoenolpyruvate--protein phosphotransferase [Desulfobacteraceae bacterium]
MNRTVTDQIILKGISGSPGICIGKAYLVDQEGVNLIKRYPISPDMVPNEIDRFKSAVDKAQKDHAKAIDAIGDDLSENLNILETHMVLFKDKLLYGKTIEFITNDNINAEWALRRVSRRIRRMFDQINDPYLRTRGDDIIQVSDKIMNYLVGEAEI